MRSATARLTRSAFGRIQRHSVSPRLSLAASSHVISRHFSQAPISSAIERAGALSMYPTLSASIKKMSNEGDELGFAWVSPKALVKGLEGPILARLLSVPGLNLVGARMYSPSEEMIAEYVEAYKSLKTDASLSHVQKYFESLSPKFDEERGFPNKLLLLLFTGKNVRAVIQEAIGDELPDVRTARGSQIRGSYGYHNRDPLSGEVTAFEPGLCCAHNEHTNRAFLKIFAKYADTCGGILIDKAEWKNTGLVIIKPDKLKRPSAVPGHIMDLFSATGLQLVGCRLFSMSIAEAQEFYGFLQPIFAKKLSGQVETVLRSRLEGAFDFDLNNSELDVMTALLKQRHAQAEVNKIVHYMSGNYPYPEMSKEEKMQPGTARCLALLYKGEDAIKIIREKLGATNPGEAKSGTIRSDYGSDIMKNSAHASDSLESLQRERRIIGMELTREERYKLKTKTATNGYVPSNVKAMIDLWLAHTSTHPVTSLAALQKELNIPSNEN